MKKTIYLHIGFGKTGTTAIQYFFDKRRGQLLEQDFLYPQTGIQIGGHHLLAPLGVERISGHVKTLYLNLLQEIEKSTANKIFISSENFIFSTPSFIEDLKQELSPFDVKIIFYVRRQELLIESIFLQWQKVGDDYLGGIEKFFRTHKGSFDFYRKITPWAACFGEDSIIARLYERNLIGDDICCDIVNLLNLHPLSAEKGGRENASLRPEFATLIGLIDAAGVQKEDRIKIVGELLSLSEKFGSMKKETLLSYELKQEIAAYYRESNQKFSEKYFSPERAVMLCSNEA